MGYNGIFLKYRVLRNVQYYIFIVFSVFVI